MPANAKIVTSNSPDSTAGQFVVSIGGTTGPRWHASKVELRVGRNASTATVLIELDQNNDETAPTIAGIASSLFHNIKTFTRATVLWVTAGGVSTTVFTGSVIDKDPDIGKDAGVLELADDRWMLEGVQFVGSWWYSSGSTNNIEYRQGWPSHFNPRGMPNCMYITGTENDIPVFCPPNYGLADGEAVPEPRDPSAMGVKAVHWDLQAQLDYARFFFSTTAYDRAKLFYHYPKLPTSVIWPAGYSSAIDKGDLDTGSTTLNNNAATVAEGRKGRESIWEGVPLLAALSEVVEAAGAYGIYLAPMLENQSQIQIVRTRYKGGGIQLNRPADGDAGGNDPKLAAINVINAGSLKLSARNTYTRVAVHGGLVYVERRVYSQLSSTSAERNDDNGTRGLVRAFPRYLLADLFDEIKTLMNAAGETTAAQALAQFKKLLKKPKYAKCYSHYRITSTYDFQAGTSESTFPLAKLGRPVAPHQLTSFLERTPGTSDSAVTTYSRLSARTPIYVEYNSALTGDEPNSATWNLYTPQSDGLKIEADGSIVLDGLRDLGLTYNTPTVTLDGSTVTAVEIRARALRMNLAIPTDHRLFKAVKLATDEADNIATVSLADGDEGQIESSSSVSRSYYADAAQLYTKHVRSTGSWPTPETVVDATAATGVALRDDSDYALAHAHRKIADVGRLQRDGRLITPHIDITAQPGQAISDILNVGIGSVFPIRGIVHTVIFHNKEKDQITERILS